MDKKVSIVTRAYNRLEYTIKCIDNIKKITNYDNFEHIIINNNSTDGTKEWLNWIKDSGVKYFKHVKPIHFETNLGDWGGLLEATKHVSLDSEYFIQLDNDIEIFDPEWLNKMIYVLENTKHNIVQLKRSGVKTVINPVGLEKIQYNNEVLIYGRIHRPVACFILKTQDFKKQYSNLENTGFYDGKTRLSELLGGTVKIANVSCNIIDGYKNKHYLNYEKYPSDLQVNNINVIQELK